MNRIALFKKIIIRVLSVGAIMLGVQAYAMASAAQVGDYLYVAATNEDHQRIITVIDTTTNQPVGAPLYLDTDIVPSFGGWVASIAASPDGAKVYVAGGIDLPEEAQQRKSTAWVITTADNQIEEINLPPDSNPSAFVVSPNSTTVYIVDSGRLLVLDAATNSQIDTIEIDANPVSIAMSPDGNKLYVVHQIMVGYRPLKSSISVITTANNQLVDRIYIDFPLGSIAISPDNTRGYVVSSEYNLRHHMIWVFSTEDNQVLNIINTPSDSTSGPYDVTVSLDGTKIYVTESSRILVITTADNQIVDRIETEEFEGPVEYNKNKLYNIVISQDGSRLYMVSKGPNSNDTRDMVLVSDTRDNKVIKQIKDDDWSFLWYAMS